jgi:hypothetical protein
MAAISWETGTELYEAEKGVYLPAFWTVGTVLWSVGRAVARWLEGRSPLLNDDWYVGLVCGISCTVLGFALARLVRARRAVKAEQQTPRSGQ